MGIHALHHVFPGYRLTHKWQFQTNFFQNILNLLNQTCFKLSKVVLCECLSVNEMIKLLTYQSLDSDVLAMISWFALIIFNIVKSILGDEFTYKHFF